MYVGLLIVLVTLIFVPRHTLVWRWIIGTLKGLDCTLNCLLFLGDYRETVSGRIGKAYLANVSWVFIFYWVLNLIFYPIEGNANHCKDSIDWNVGDLAIWRWRE